MRHVRIKLIKPPRNLTRNFHMRHLVLPHRNKIGLIDQDIGGLEQRVPKEPVGA
jgi:hypothetical protein